MRADWIEIKYRPKEVGHYLVTTAKDKVVIDRWDGETWGKCTPRSDIKGRSYGKYRQHKAWTPLPPSYKGEDE